MLSPGSPAQPKVVQLGLKAEDSGHGLYLGDGKARLYGHCSHRGCVRGAAGLAGVFCLSLSCMLGGDMGHRPGSRTVILAIPCCCYRDRSWFSQQRCWLCQSWLYLLHGSQLGERDEGCCAVPCCSPHWEGWARSRQGSAGPFLVPPCPDPHSPCVGSPQSLPAASM